MLNRLTAVLLMLLCCLSMATSSWGVVIGREGAVYEIEECDFLKVIEERVAALDENELKDKWQKAVKSQAREFVLPDRADYLPPATKPSFRNVDLTYTLPYDIKDIYGQVIFPKGFKVNPLEELRKKKIPYPHILVVINGNRKVEVEWFKAKMASQMNAKLVITEGYPYQVAESIGRPAYQLTEIIKTRFKIEETPSIVWWPSDSLYLAVQTFPLSEPNEAPYEGPTPGKSLQDYYSQGDVAAPAEKGASEAAVQVKPVSESAAPESEPVEHVEAAQAEPEIAPSQEQGVVE